MKGSGVRVSPSALGSGTSEAPGAFDADLESLAPELVTVRDGDPTATRRILVSVEGEAASRLQRIADAQGKKPGDVVADLLRAADRSAA